MVREVREAQEADSSVAVGVAGVAQVVRAAAIRPAATTQAEATQGIRPSSNGNDASD